MHAAKQNASYARLIRIHQNQGAALADCSHAQFKPQPMVLRATLMSRVVFVSHFLSETVHKQMRSCPAPESECKEAGTTLVTMRTHQAFTVAATLRSIFECHESDDCPGGLAHEQCRDGHTGVLCAVCAENFVRVNGVCSYCDTRNAAALTGLFRCYSDTSGSLARVLHKRLRQTSQK